MVGLTALVPIAPGSVVRELTIVPGRPTSRGGMSQRGGESLGDSRVFLHRVNACGAGSGSGVSYRLVRSAVVVSGQAERAT
jgi:hypothetical protein